MGVTTGERKGEGRQEGREIKKRRIMRESKGVRKRWKMKGNEVRVKGVWEKRLQ